MGGDAGRRHHPNAAVSWPAGVALVGVPVAIVHLGFTAAGITPLGSVAAKMMSAAAIANGGGVAAGSIVAVLQSIGAAGLSLAAKIGLTSVLGSLGAAAGAKLSGDDTNFCGQRKEDDSSLGPLICIEYWDPGAMAGTGYQRASRGGRTHV
ncbi:interferon alpha-inducible protein 27-like protein 1 [Pluvialis apricaria]